MKNARIIHINSINEANEEIRKIGVDASAFTWLVPKSIHITIKLEGVTSYIAAIIKQEMLSKGGDAAVHRAVVNNNIELSDILIMGTLSQYNKLIYKLKMQSPSFQEIAEEIIKLLQVIQEGKPKYFECRKHKLPIGEETYIMGILNITPDSFSDGGIYNDIESAIKKAKEMVQNGAHIIDIGGESTRPGFTPIDSITEINRIIPVIEKLAKEIEVPISVDTSKAVVAEKALQGGASIVNDIWGLTKDAQMADVIARYNAGVIIMHNNQDSSYEDLMGDIIKFLRQSIKIAEKNGIRKESIIVDPGIGFGKTLDQNIEIMKKLKELASLNLPVLIGTSKKSLIGKVLDLPVNERLEGTAATVTLGISNGADFIRVHDVKEMARVARMTDAMVRT